MELQEWIKELPTDTKGILNELMGTFSTIFNTEYSDFSEGINNIEFYIQDKNELIPVWYVHRSITFYDGGSKKLNVVFRPNLKKKRLKPDWLRTSPERLSYKELDKLFK